MRLCGGTDNAVLGWEEKVRKENLTDDSRKTSLTVRIQMALQEAEPVAIDPG